MCRSPPPQARLALGLGAAVSRGRGVPELCPHLALHMEVSQVQAQLGHAPAPGPAHKRRRAAAQTAAAAEQAAASENVAKEVTGSLTEQVAKALTKQEVA